MENIVDASYSYGHYISTDACKVLSSYISHVFFSKQVANVLDYRGKITLSLIVEHISRNVSKEHYSRDFYDAKPALRNNVRFKTVLLCRQ